jgi:hypothetical protein
MRPNLLKAGFSRQRPFSGIPGSFSWILLILAVVVTVPFSQVPRPPPVPATPPPATVLSVETQINAEGFDSHRRALPFTVFILTHELSWKLESASDLEGGQSLLSPDLTAAINRARDVFCVGTASFEGAPRTEEARAAQRASRLTQWVAAIIRNPGHTRLFALNAGQYQGPPELDSAYQRKAILIVTGPHEEEVDLSEGLTSGLEQQQQAFPVVYSLLHDYSRSNEWLEALKGQGGAKSRRTSAVNRRRLAGVPVRQ